MTFTKRATRHRVLLIDDHPMVRRGLAEILSDQPDLEVCGEAEDSQNGLKQFQATNPDLVILDLSLKGGHGVDLIKSLKAKNREVRILVFSMHDDSLFAERVLSAGALGYVNKQVDSSTLLSAMRRVLEGRVYLNPEITERVLMRLADAGQTIDQQPIESLSDRELEVFELIGQGLGTQQIAERLFLSHKTIETYRENIKRKLNLPSASELTRHAVLWLLERR